MDDGLQMGVIIIKDVRADAVDQGGMQDVETFAAAQKIGFGLSHERSKGGNGPLYRLMPRPADRDPGIIQHSPADFPLDRLRQVARLCLDDVMAEDRCDGRGRADRQDLSHDGVGQGGRCEGRAKQSGSPIQIHPFSPVLRRAS